jgi:hypothetical protein
MANKHTVKAWLYDNLLTENPNDLIARVDSERSLSIKNIAVSATTRGGANIPAASIEHAVNIWFREMAYNLCDGYGINTEWFSVMPTIRGVFSSPRETFNSGKHTILFDFRQGRLLRKELETVTVEILGLADTSLNIMQVTDVKTGSVNDLLTPGRNLKISGYKLKIAGNNPNNGIYFVNDAAERIKVDVSDMAVNNPSELIIIIPELKEGTYQLEVTTQYGKNTALKEPRTAVFDKILTVK